MGREGVQDRVGLSLSLLEKADSYFYSGMTHLSEMNHFLVSSKCHGTEGTTPPPPCLPRLSRGYTGENIAIFKDKVHRSQLPVPNKQVLVQFASVFALNFRQFTVHTHTLMSYILCQPVFFIFANTFNKNRLDLPLPSTIA